MSEVWEAGPEVKEMVATLVASYHPDLALILDKIAIIFKEKSTKSGGVTIFGKSRKAPEVLKILGKKPFIFVLEIGGDTWLTLSDTQRIALLDHLLCACRLKSDEEGEGLKYFLAPPDFSFYKEEILRHGIWQTLDPEDNTSDIAATHIEESFSNPSLDSSE